MEIPDHIQNITGQKWHHLTAVSYSHSKRGAYWFFVCDCGNKKIFTASLVRTGKRKSCGCKNRAAAQEGMVFKGCVLAKRMMADGHGTRGAFICHCGGFFSALIDNVSRGSTSSCGCRHYTLQGKSREKSYHVWRHMLMRCTNKKDKRYSDYGGRGVKVCERWMDYLNFFQDMGNPPEGMTIERKNNSLGYSPENCRWATIIEQANNKRNNRFISYDGRSQTLAMWAREKGINPGTLKSRLDKGWDLERALKK